MRSEIERKAELLLEKCDTSVLACVTEEGYPRACVMAKLKADGYATIWFATGTNTTKAALLRANPRASVCYYRGDDSVTLIGEVEIVDDPKCRKELWADWMAAFFPKGVEDPQYIVMKFTTKEATIWIDWQFETYRYESS